MKKFKFYTSGNKVNIDVDHVDCNDKLVSAKLSFFENKANIDWLNAQSVEEEMPIAEQGAFAKHLQREKMYYDKLYPSVYEEGKLLLGWKEKTIAYDDNNNLTICYPSRMEDDIIQIWRAYDTQRVFRMVIVGKKITNTGTLLFVLPSDNVTHCQDNGNVESWGEQLEECPFIKGKSIGRHIFEATSKAVAEKRITF